MPSHPHAHRAPDFNRAPMVVFWEITRACALVCRHCRASAQPKRHPLELTTDEGRALLRELTRFEPPPVLIVSGGDPLMRRDLFELIAYGASLGLRVALSPSVTALVTQKNLARAREAGVKQISFSLDGATPEVHDGFRGVAGSFDRTLWAVRTAREEGLPVQVNTTVSRWNRHQLEAIGELVARYDLAMWDLFFLVPTGRGLAEDLLSPQEHEEVFNWIYDYTRNAPFRVKVTLGQHYRRVAFQRAEREGRPPPRVPATNDGRGVCFVSHIGEIYPSGFLPLACGNVRRDSLVEVYQSHPVFTALRDPDRLKGKCGVCPFRFICGGCRARAYALTGDYLAQEPACVFQPDGVGQAEEALRAP